MSGSTIWSKRKGRYGSREIVWLRAKKMLAALWFMLAPSVLFCQLTEPAADPIKPVHLRLHLATPPQAIPGTLFGSFLEPIGHSTYGGLWADLIVNPSFESGLWSVANEEAMVRENPELRRASQLGLPLPWEPLDSAQGNRYLPVRGDAANSNQSLLIMSLPKKEVGILQRIYLPLHREVNYNGSLWIRHLSGPAEVKVALRRHAHPDEVLASAAVHAAANVWTKYSFRLSLVQGQLARLEPADITISFADDARAEIDNVNLMPADAIEGMDPDVLALARELESPLIRFGGNFTSAYRWTDGIGPLDKRVSMLNPSWGIPEYNTFGTDEFLRFCKAIQAQPQVALNLGTGTPDEAAAWVKYINEHWNVGKGGLLWELGNELWGDFQIGYPSQERVAAVTLASSKAVKAVDPKSILIATGGDEDFFHDWNAQQLTNPVGTFNYLSTHFVVTDDVLLQKPPKDFRTMAALALPWGLSERMHAIYQQMADSGHPEARIAFTEWLMVSQSRTAPHFTNLGGALFAGGFLNMVMRNADVVSISDMTGIIEFGGIWKKKEQVFGAPAYWVLREYAHAKPEFLVDISSDSPTYSVSHGIRRLPEIKDVPFLDCAAALSEGRKSLVLACVNRHLTRSFDAQMDLSSMSIRTGTAEVATLQGDNILSENDEENPNRIIPVRSRVSVSEKGQFAYRFPSASVTILQIPLRP